TREKIITMVKKLGDNVELEEKINENIIGGFIIRVGDKQYDESIASRLSAMKRAFAKNPYISEL
ncbi:MAG TPA: F0F1 ATP synthase subunit delta, partial [Cryomorphaceae bacterium]|nr:F0F1 ATP synthase subunit delta [Cryomorphaceae bacterium]